MTNSSAANASSSYKAELIRDLERIAEAVRFPSENSFVLGDLPEVTVEPASTSKQRPDPELVERLVDALYWNAYVQKFDPDALRSSDSVELKHDPEYSCEFDAHEKKDRWDEGWRVESVMPDGSVQARKNDCYRAPVPGEFAFDVPGVRPMTFGTRFAPC
jgi:hypothetical protein